MFDGFLYRLGTWGTDTLCPYISLCTTNKRSSLGWDGTKEGKKNHRRRRIMGGGQVRASTTVRRHSSNGHRGCVYDIIKIIKYYGLKRCSIFKGTYVILSIAFADDKIHVHKYIMYYTYIQMYVKVVQHALRTRLN